MTKYKFLSMWNIGKVLDFGKVAARAEAQYRDDGRFDGFTFFPLSDISRIRKGGTN